MPFMNTGTPAGIRALIQNIAQTVCHAVERRGQALSSNQQALICKQASVAANYCLT